MSIRVMIADDHPVVREGLRSAILQSDADIEVVAEAANGLEALGLSEAHAVDVYIIDVAMPLLNGIDTTVRLRRQNPDARVIILSIHDSEGIVTRAIEAGVNGYVLKETATRDIVHAIREVYRGGYFLSPGISKYVVRGFLATRQAAARGIKMLTSREREVLQLVAEGFSTKGIAARLDVSANTVHVHKNNIRSKLGLHKQADLVRYAVREGLVKA